MNNETQQNAILYYMRRTLEAGTVKQQENSKQRERQVQMELHTKVRVMALLQGSAMPAVTCRTGTL